jgi:hypothetical protein
MVIHAEDSTGATFVSLSNNRPRWIGGALGATSRGVMCVVLDERQLGKKVLRLVAG